MQSIQSTQTIAFTYNGHIGIDGNENAHQMAKQAAMTISNSVMRSLKSARSTDIHKSTETQCKKQWKEAREDAAQLRNISTQPNTTADAKLYQEIGNLQHIAWIARRQTGHCSPN